MATSDVYTMTVTGVTMAAAIARVLGLTAVDMGDSLDAGVQSAIIEAINMWLLQQKGRSNRIKPGQMMWTREEASLILTATASYELKPSGGDLDIQIPVQILNANLKDTDGNENTLKPMTVYEYQAISKKTETSTPTKYYYEKRPTVGNFTLNCVPADITDVIDILYREPLELIDSSTNDFDIEDFWYRAIKFNVALDFALEAQVSDPNKLGLISDRAKESMGVVSSFFPEDSKDFFQPGKDD